jgi:DNA-binding MarR family transcriptional regulator
MGFATLPSLDHLALDLFEVFTRLALPSLRSRRRTGDLREVEFLTLSLLQGHGTMIVGDIQKLLGVLPAQMSRIIRSLEGRDRPLIHCRINARDKRKVDVAVTAAGEKALSDYQADRVGRLAERLRVLSEDDLEDLARLGQKLAVLLRSNGAAE